MSLYDEWLERNPQAQSFDTSCRKCRRFPFLLPNLKDGKPVTGERPIILIFGYKCSCGHNNDLTARKGFQEYRTEWMKGASK